MKAPNVAAGCFTCVLHETLPWSTTTADSLSNSPPSMAAADADGWIDDHENCKEAGNCAFYFLVVPSCLSDGRQPRHTASFNLSQGKDRRVKGKPNT